MHAFNPYYSQVYSTAKVGIKVHVLGSFCFISAAYFHAFISVPTNAEILNCYPQLFVHILKLRLCAQ